MSMAAVTMTATTREVVDVTLKSSLRLEPIILPSAALCLTYSSFSRQSDVLVISHGFLA